MVGHLLRNRLEDHAMRPIRLPFNNCLWTLLVVLTSLYSSTAFALKVDFEALNIGDPPSAIPPAYPGLTGASGPPGTSIQSGVPYVFLNGKVVEVTNGGVDEYIGFSSVAPTGQPFQRVIVDVAHLPTNSEGLTDSLVLTCLVNGVHRLDDRFTTTLQSSGYYEATIDFNQANYGTNIPCDEIRISSDLVIGVGPPGRPLGHLAVDCLRLDDTSRCSVTTIDTDNDGVPDGIDQCPASELDFAFIKCGPIPNPVDPVTGCTRADDIDTPG